MSDTHTDSEAKTKSDVYRERNLLAMAFIRNLQDELRDDCGWWPDTDAVNGEEWAVVWADTQYGQVGWHVPREMAEEADWLPKADPEYDGYSTAAKNDRVAALAGLGSTVPPYTGYCEDCNAKHGIGPELAAEERGCMCGGEIVPLAEMDTLTISINHKDHEVPDTLSSESDLLIAAGFDDRKYSLYWMPEDGATVTQNDRVGDPAAFDEGDTFVAVPDHVTGG